MQLFLGNCLDILPDLPACSVDSIVTDPPYGLNFMGKRWDYDVPSVEIWKECLRVLKPGGHLLAFGGTRTYHRLVVAIEDAGFEIRDQIQWIYGQGFPKSQDVAKAIDKTVGAEREVIGTYKIPGHGKDNVKQGAQNRTKFEFDKYSPEPVSDDAKKWSGWGTALKPANEPICLARKPLSESTIAKNVLKHGTGGLNIDGTRIEGQAPSVPQPKGGSGDIYGFKNGEGRNGEMYETHFAGRFPSNVILDEDAAAVLDEQSGHLPSSKRKPQENSGYQDKYVGGEVKKKVKRVDYDGDGGASRFFKVVEGDIECSASTAKPNFSQQSELDDFVQKLVAISGRQDTTLSNTLKAFTQEMRTELKPDSDTDITTILSTVRKFSQELWLTSMSNNSPVSVVEAQMLIDTMRITQSLLRSSFFAEAATSSTMSKSKEHGGQDLVGSRFLYQAKASKSDRGPGNSHPTVKPIKLMEYLIRLVTPPGGTILDPFAGSGTTGIAALNLGFKFIGMEISEEYHQIAEKRLHKVEVTA